MVWDGSRWLLDQGDMLIERLAKATITAMIEEAAATSEEDERKFP